MLSATGAPNDRFSVAPYSTCPHRSGNLVKEFCDTGWFTCVRALEPCKKRTKSVKSLHQNGDTIRVITLDFERRRTALIELFGKCTNELDLAIWARSRGQMNARLRLSEISAEKPGDYLQ